VVGFLSHTSELRDFPLRGVVCGGGAGSAAGHVIVDMADFPAANQPAVRVCEERVHGRDVYVGCWAPGTAPRIGTVQTCRTPSWSSRPLRRRAFPRLVFLLDTDANDVDIPVSKLTDHEFGGRQEAFRRRVRDSGLTIQSFASPAQLGNWWSARSGSWPCGERRGPRRTGRVGGGGGYSAGAGWAPAQG